MKIVRKECVCMFVWIDFFENRIYLFVMYLDFKDYLLLLSWIGGNVFVFFDDNVVFVFLCEQNYLFYFSVIFFDINFKEFVLSQEMIFVFVLVEYERYFENNIYLICDIQVFLYFVFFVSVLEIYINFLLVKYSLIEWIWVEDGVVIDELCLVRIGGILRFIQQEDSYFIVLYQDGYSFFIQIDEEGYVDGMVEEYVFGYGVLYLFVKFDDGKWIDFIVGFWQYLQFGNVGYECFDFGYIRMWKQI